MDYRPYFRLLSAVLRIKGRWVGSFHKSVFFSDDCADSCQESRVDQGLKSIFASVKKLLNRKVMRDERFMLFACKLLPPLFVSEPVWLLFCFLMFGG